MDFFLLLPECALAAMILMFFAATLAKPRQAVLEGCAVAGALCVFAAAWYTYGRSGLFFHDVYKVDTFSQTFKLIIVARACTDPVDGRRTAGHHPASAARVLPVFEPELLRPVRHDQRR